MRKVTIQLSEDLVRKVKLLAAEELTTIAAIVTRALENETKKGGKNRTKRPEAARHGVPPP